MKKTKTELRVSSSMATARQLFISSLGSDQGGFLPRIGGSDFDAIAHWSDPLYSWAYAAKSIPGKLVGTDKLQAFDPRKSNLEKRVRELNGFFDITPKTDHNRSFQRFLRSISDSISSAETIFYASQNLIKSLEGGPKHPITKWVEDYSSDKQFVSYAYMEDLSGFFSDFREIAEDRKLLVVSPFPRSVEHQVANYSKSLSQEFPRLKDLITVKVPVTYNVGRTDLSVRSQTEHMSWHLVLQDLLDEIETADFDLALLACGSYSNPIGSQIAASGRTAVYVGGMLSVLFNLESSRYNIPYYRAAWTNSPLAPFEKAELLKLSGGKRYHSEALRAYL